MILSAYEALVAEAERSPAFSQLLTGRAAHTARRSAALFAKGIPAPLNAKQFEALRQRIRRFHQTIMEAQPNAESKAA